MNTLPNPLHYPQRHGLDTYHGTDGQNITQVAFLTFTFPPYVDVPESFMRAALIVEQVVNAVTGDKMKHIKIPYMAYAIERHRADIHKTKELNAK